MKKLLLTVFVCLAVAFSGTYVYAASDNVAEGMGLKLFRGVVNTFTGWVELPAQIVKGWNKGFMGNEDNKVVGAIVGIFTGLSHSAGRTFSGVEDAVTFWAPDAESNSGIGLPLDAEYAWQQGDAYNIFEPNLWDGACVPIGSKFLRGAGNAFFGVLEVPGQIAKGIKGKAWDIGIVKGVWFFLGREVEGAGDMTSALLPNPADTKAYPYDEKWGWSALGDSFKK
ncbi:MAG: exosortase system-associated protein, TIGR04073 family [Candidatus Omnitrophica bacterium]|nr:exosortase system-associated protein, TIGR04073 family [Candidatus Omnitrophota bacterium]